MNALRKAKHNNWASAGLWRAPTVSLLCSRRSSDGLPRYAPQDPIESETTALRTEHVDFLNSNLSVCEGRGAKGRTLWVGGELLGELRHWMKRCGDEVGASKFPLSTRKDTEVATSHLRRSVNQYARRSDIEEPSGVSPPTLRHTFATWLYRDTGNIRMVQRALGPLDYHDLRSRRRRRTGGRDEGALP